jgi:uncharacterized protein YndB with AHSA1/START domain
MDYNPKLDLILERKVPLTTAQLWKAWSDPNILKKWFCPIPWKTIDCEMDLRPGGIFRTTMESPDGEQYPSVGCYLEIDVEKKLVWTNSLLPDYRPNLTIDLENDFYFTAFIMMNSSPKNPQETNYKIILKHGSKEDCEKHQDLGFQEGWSAALDQLINLF